MSPNRHSISAVSTAKKFKTPLKASVVLLTSMILAACNTTDDPSYNLDDVFSPIPGATDAALEKAKAEAEKAKEEAKKAREEAEAAKKEAAEQIAAAEKAAEEKADAAIKSQQEAEAAAAAAEKAKAEAIKAQEEAEKALEEALANGGGSEALQKEADRKAKLAEEAKADAQAAEAAAQAAQQKAEAEATAAQAAQQAAQDAAQDAEIKNAPESVKTGVQHVSIDASGLGQGALTTTTRDFDITDETQVDARADEASGGLVSDPVALKVSGDNDDVVAESNGFKSFENTTKVNTSSLGEVDLVYTSTYKDFGDDLRVAHIDGAAAGLLPVNGVAVVGNATQAENMPTEGKVGYTGDATYRETGQNKDIKFGTSVFTADFVAKNIKGDLTFSDKNIGLEADIDGNKFSGSKDDYNTDGGFYGGDGQYVGGIYEGNGAQGTYGAKSDAQIKAEEDAKEAAGKADATEEALANAKDQAAQAQAAAEKAQADAAKAQEAAKKAQEAADNAGSGGDDEALQDALDRAEAAEKAAEKAEADAKIAIQEATNKAKDEVKAAQDKVAAAQSEAAAAKNTAAAAKAEAEAAEKDAEAKIAAAKSAAKEDVAEANKAADLAKEEARKAKDAQKEAEGDTKAAEDRATAAAAAQAAAEKKAQELQDKLDAINNPDEYKSEAETEKSGVQHLSVDASGLGQGVKATTTRDFAIRSTSDVDARADLALEGIVPEPIAIKVSGDNDTDTANGFKSHEGTADVLAEGDLAYTSVYKDFGENGEMRIAHIDGAVSAGGGAITVPVDGVAVVGNKTATLPTEGKFEYAGDATNRQLGAGNDIEYGSSEFTADFVDKKIDGTLKFAQAGDISLGGDIDGNEFSGKKGDYNTDGAFYGEDANYIGGIYEGNESQGTFGAEKDGTPADVDTPVEPELPEPPVNPGDPANEDVTGVMSNTISSEAGLGTDDAIGFRQFVTDNETFTETTGEGEEMTPTIVEDNTVDNLPGYDQFEARLDIVKPNKFKQTATITTVRDSDIAFDADSDFMKSDGQNTVTFEEVGSIVGDIELKYDYDSVYKNFNSQMQIGHVYGDLRKENPFGGVKSRYANVYVVGNSTAQADMDYMQQQAQYNIDNNINDGNVQYAGVATYMDNIHLGSGAINNPVVNGESNFDVDFVNNSLSGKLDFAEIDKNIDIKANIEGNTFAGREGNVETSGGFYGEDANFLGGIYQEAQLDGEGGVPGTGTEPGTGTTFQGTFGAEKAPK